MGHNTGIHASVFGGFIAFDDEEMEEDAEKEFSDTEEEFPDLQEQVIRDRNGQIQFDFEGMTLPPINNNSSKAEFDAAPNGHNEAVHFSELVPGMFSNICFVMEDEPPVKSCIRRVQDLDESDYTEKESLNQELFQDPGGSEDSFVQVESCETDGKLKHYNSENNKDKVDYNSAQTVDSTPGGVQRSQLGVNQERLNKSAIGINKGTRENLLDRRVMTFDMGAELF